jgi:hypothetical protein
VTGGAFEIRLAKLADYAAIGEIFRRSFRKIASRNYSAEQIVVWSAHSDDKVLRAERMRSRVNYLSVQHGQIIVFVQYEPPDHLDMSYIHPDF